MKHKTNKELIQHQIDQFKYNCKKLRPVSDLAASCENDDVFDHFLHDDGIVIWDKMKIQQLWDFWQTAQVHKPMEDYPIYSVVGMDLENDEPHIVLGDDYLMVSEVFHTNNSDEAHEKLKQFKAAFPKVMVTNNAVIAIQYLDIRRKKIEKELGMSNGGW